MTNEPNLAPITLEESKRLIELEKIIEAGRRTFIEVGIALAEIRDARLYKSDFKTFEDYCVHKWGWTKQHCYRLIECAPIAKSNPQVTSINQARELAKVPAEKREAVIKTAVAKSRATRPKLTAKAIKTAASAEAISDAAAVVPESESIGNQLRELWGKANPSERENFLTWIKTHPSGENPARLKCDSCDAEFEDDDEAVTLYECNDCGTRFTRETSANENHQCPGCNKFGSKVTDCGCPACNEGELVNVNGAA